MFPIWVSFNNTLLTNNSIRVVEQVGLEPNPPDCKSSALANYATSPDVIIKTVVYHHLSLWISLSFERVSGYYLIKSEYFFSPFRTTPTFQPSHLNSHTMVGRVGIEPTFKTKLRFV